MSNSGSSSARDIVSKASHNFYICKHSNFLMLDQKKSLEYYSREEILNEIAYNSKDREIAVRFNESFCKRPDIIKYPQDIIEFAKTGATSFHCSIELWKNPLQLGMNIDRRQLNELRTGWDLVIDIDCKLWEISKLVTHLIIQALKKHGVKDVSCKFSGNKGFHIGVPYEAFILDEKINNAEIKKLFPDAPKKIIAYLANYIDRKEENYHLTKLILSKYPSSEIAKILNVKHEKLFKKICAGCGKETSTIKAKNEKVSCPQCMTQNEIPENASAINCKKCNLIIKIPEIENKPRCKNCKETEFIEKLNTEYIIGIDTILISTRHLFRMAYSMHESSSLCSLPINPEEVLAFEKQQATPETVKPKFRFLNKESVLHGQGKSLLIQSYDFYSSQQSENPSRAEENYEYKLPEKAIPKEHFPPCIKLLLEGISDGKKRSLFILLNFLKSSGYNYDDIRKIISEWNKKNPEPIRENYIEGQITYHLSREKNILPPNCKNQMYYIDIGVCKPDNLCARISNPVNYAVISSGKTDSGKKTRKKK